jgi:hypothetical protein
MDKNYVIRKNDYHFQLKEARLYYKNKTKNVISKLRIISRNGVVPSVSNGSPLFE